MRTKTLITSAVLSIAGAAALQAQVYSVNAVGYINIDVAPGFNLLANQLNNGDNKVSDLFMGHDKFMAIYKHDAATGEYTINNYEPPSEPGAGDAIWDDPDMELNPGEGFWLRNLDNAGFTLTLVGEVPQGTLTKTLLPGYNLVASMVPQAGGLMTDLGVPAEDFNTVLLHSPTEPSPGLNDTGSYNSYEYEAGEWFDMEPMVEVGEGIWYRHLGSTPLDWTRDFNVNQ
jgi:hypothetical protein